MAKKRSSASDPGSAAAVTPERFRRLHRLLSLLADKPQTRAALVRRLRLDVRGFYRDLEALRAVGISVRVSDGRYSLGETVAEARARLPFPDPHLTLGEVQQLARGAGTVRQKLRDLVESWLGG